MNEWNQYLTISYICFRLILDGRQRWSTSRMWCCFYRWQEMNFLMTRNECFTAIPTLYLGHQKLKSRWCLLLVIDSLYYLTFIAKCVEIVKITYISSYCYLVEKLDFIKRCCVYYKRDYLIDKLFQKFFLLLNCNSCTLLCYVNISPQTVI